MTTGTKVAAALAGVTALATTTPTTAYAWDTHDTTKTWWGYEAPTLDRDGLVNAEVLAAYVDAKLDAVTALVAKVDAKVATMRRHEAAWWLGKVQATRRALAYVKDPAFAERVAALDDDLADLAARLDARIDALVAAAEAKTVTPTRVRPVKATTVVFGTRFDGDHQCDGWDGWRDGSRDSDRRWDGWRRR